MPSNDSTTGGYLSPALTPAPLEGKALNDFLQEVVVGITGLTPSLARPRWQTEPPNTPDLSAGCWCACGPVGDREADTNHVEVLNPLDDAGNGSVDVMRHEVIRVLCSFYDDGESGKADYYAEVLREGLGITQNQDNLSAQGFAFIEVLPPTPVPSLAPATWRYRVDIAFRVKRKNTRNYPIRSILSYVGTVVTDFVTS